MTFAVNDSPYAGREGDKVQSRVIRDRLEREAEGNVAIRVTESAERDAFEVAGRGELQLGVLIETMRREGFELSISRPRVLFRDGPKGREEPYETVVIDVDDEYRRHRHREDGAAQGRDDRHAPGGGGKTRLTFSRAQPRPDRLSRRVPLRHPRHRHHEPPVRTLRPVQGPDPGPPERRADLHGAGRGGALRAQPLEERGMLFIAPGEKLYEGMIIGENAKPQDLEVNPLKSKQLTNFRSTGKDEAVRLTPPRRMTPGTGDRLHPGRRAGRGDPQGIRLRKRYLDPHERKKAARAAASGHSPPARLLRFQSRPVRLRPRKFSPPALR